MASDSRSEDAGQGGVSPAKRKRLDNCFDHARKHMAQEGYDHDYATDLLSQCVNGDFSNVEYLEAFLANLHRKYNNNRRGNWLAALSGMGARNSMKKALAQEDWAGVVRYAVELLKLNPWDSATLSTMAIAAEKLGPDYDKTELKCLKSALDSQPKNPQINRQCAQALARRGEFDQAIACLHRVEKVRPDDDEVRREITNLTVRKQQFRAGGEEETPSLRAAAEGSRAQTGAAAESAPEQRLKRQISQEPEDITAYLELADLYVKADRYADAEPVLVKAMEVSGGNADIRERLDDIQLTALERRMAEAEKQARAGDAEAQEEYRRLRKKQRLKKLQVFKGRCDRYPTNLLFKYELGVCYQGVGEYNEAIKQFQAAKSDPRRKGACLLALGQCFQHIKQLRLALSHYEMAIAEIPDRDLDNKKLALYYTGRLALGLKDKEAASKYLTALAQLDFGYKDVSELLEKIEKLGKEEPEPPAENPQEE